MSVTDTRTVDALSLSTQDDTVILTITDHLEWNNEHLLLLQEKINTYLAFVESGELLEAYPKAEKKDVVIEVVYSLEPNTEARDFLENVSGVLAGAGIRFEYKTIDAIE